VNVDDRLGLRDRSEAGADPSGPAAFADAEADDHGSVSLQALDLRGGQVARLRPLRILIISADNRFRTVMSLLLARRNCSVRRPRMPVRVAELVGRRTSTSS